ncbi:MAG: hypothetical protein AABZ74_00540 [Cyanobacteriota bacterium]
MKKFLLTVFGCICLSNTATAYANSIKIDYVYKTTQSTSESSFYYSENASINELQRNFIPKGSSLNVDFITEIYEPNRNDVYISFNSLKTFQLFKNDRPNKSGVRLIFPYQATFNNHQNIRELEAKLFRDGFIRRTDEKIRLVNKDLNCIVFEKNRQINHNDKIWFSKNFMYPVKRNNFIKKVEFYPKKETQYIKEVKYVKENTHFDKKFTFPSNKYETKMKTVPYNSNNNSEMKMVPYSNNSDFKSSGKNNKRNHNH